MITLTWFGTATILLNINGEKLLFDPFFRWNKKLEQPHLEEFCNVDYIFNTHPHFDHLCDVPRILEKTQAKIYGTPTMLLRLETQDPKILNNIEIVCPHDKIKTQNAEITVYRSQHVENDIGIILKTASRVIFKFQYSRAMNILKTHNKFRMGGDIVAFNIKADNKSILLFGSAGYDESLPKDVDVMIWPFQGRTNMSKFSIPIVEKINPKKIILDHFDDAFPPITGHINTKKFVKKIKQKRPETIVITPEYKKTIEI